MKQKVLLVDGSSLAFRMYFALERTQMKSPDGRPSWAIYGFLKQLVDLMERERPDLTIIAFDTAAPTFRHHAYDLYKANRPDAMPEELQQQWPEIQRGSQALGITILKQDGDEADDIIGTLSKTASDQGWDVEILTGDKDSFQLVNDSVTVWYPSQKELQKITHDVVIAKIGVRPDQIVDYKALAGDSSDNIPGVPGVGPKTAVKLLADYTDLDGVYSHIEKLKGNLKTKLIDNKDKAYLSQFLAQIKLDCELEGQFPDSFKAIPHNGTLNAFFDEFGFKSLRKTVTDATIFHTYSGEEDDSLFDSENTNQMPIAELRAHIRECSDVQELIALCKSAHEVAIHFDVETSLWQLQISRELQQSVTYDDAVWECNTSIFVQCVDSLASDMSLNNITWLAWDIKSILHAIKDDHETSNHLAQVFISCGIKDVFLGSFIADSSQKLLLDRVYARYCSHIVQHPTHKLLLMNQYLENQLDEQERELWVNVESKLALVLFVAEQYGVMIDVSTLKAIDVELTEGIAEFGQMALELLGVDINLNSSQQLGEVLLSKGFKLNKTATGKPSTDKESLDLLLESDTTGVITAIQSHRTLSKLKNTYSEGLQKYIGPDSRIHTTFLQTGAGTGRMAATEPNIQNIPIKNEQYGSQFRSCFIAPEGRTLVVADYSQIELRFLAHFSEDPLLIEAFTYDQDIHSRTAAEIFGIHIDEVTNAQRRVGKTLNFALVYQQGVFGTAKQLGISRGEAKEFIQRYFERFTRVRPFTIETLDQAAQAGYTQTFWGRRRYFQGLTSSNMQIKLAAQRAAFNSVLQGSNADLNKIAMNDVFKAFQSEGIDAYLILQIHDELIVECDEDQAETVKRILQTKMVLNQPLKVPIKVEAHSGKNWHAAK